MAYYIGPRCSACHYCYNECPVKAIRFVGTSYEIDEFKCIGCGKCAEVCPSGIWAVGDSCKGLFQKDDQGGKFGEMPWAMASGFLAGGYAAEALK